MKNKMNNKIDKTMNTGFGEYKKSAIKLLKKNN